MFRIYNRLLQEYPVSTKSFTSAFLFGLGDFLTQQIFDRRIHNNKQSLLQSNDRSQWKYDLRRTQSMVAVGLIFAGPVLHQWYTFVLPKLVNPLPNPSKAQFVFQTLKGIVLDQTIFTGFFLVNFFVLNDLFYGKQLDKSLQNLKEIFVPTILTNWKIWPALQVINQAVLPIQYRVLFVNICGLFWNMYLSFVSYSNEDDQKKIK